jgi:predicted metal-dependent enzyme (double-stranded beta helix superfamily)
MKDLLDQLGALDAPPGLPTLARLLASVQPSAAQIRAARREDADRPYGRNVLLNTPVVEGMVATWTPGAWCLPHDHGGSVGGVRVLQGRSHHKVFAVRGGRLELVKEERVEAGEVMQCGSDLVHAMRCDGADEPLMTLHLYAGPIDHMIVYDRDATYVVDGGCGAWIPADQPELIRSRTPGIVRRP